MPQVFDTIVKPDGSPYPTAITVNITLMVPAAPQGAGGSVGSLSQFILGTLSVKTNSNGFWQTNLIGNSLISPAGTTYLIDEQVPGKTQAPFAVTVPGSGGPWWVWDPTLIPPVPPAAPGPAFLVLAADAVKGLDTYTGSLFDPVQTIAKLNALPTQGGGALAILAGGPNVASPVQTFTILGQLVVAPQLRLVGGGGDAEHQQASTLLTGSLAHTVTAATTADNLTITATAGLSATDVGADIVGPGILPNTTIYTVTGQVATLSQKAYATAGAAVLTVTPPLVKMSARTGLAYLGVKHASGVGVWAQAQFMEFDNLHIFGCAEGLRISGNGTDGSSWRSMRISNNLGIGIAVRASTNKDTPNNLTLHGKSTGNGRQQLLYNSGPDTSQGGEPPAGSGKSIGLNEFGLQGNNGYSNGEWRGIAASGTRDVYYEGIGGLSAPFSKLRAGSHSVLADLTAGVQIISSVRGMSGADVGANIEGQGIPPGTTVQGYSSGAGTAQLSQAPTLTVTAATLESFDGRLAAAFKEDHPRYHGGTANSSLIGSTTNGSNVLTALTQADGVTPIVTYDVTDSDVGRAISGTGVPASTFITGYNTAAGTITISNNATATGSAIAITITRGTSTAPLGVVDWDQCEECENLYPTFDAHNPSAAFPYYVLGPKSRNCKVVIGRQVTSLPAVNVQVVDNGVGNYVEVWDEVNQTAVVLI